MDSTPQEQNENQKSGNWLLPASIVVAAVLIAGAVIYATGSKNLSSDTGNEKLKEFTVDAAAALGNQNAPVKVFVVGDYQCPFCAIFSKETESLIVKNYVEAGEIQLIFKNISFLGNESLAAAEAVECAKDQSNYWQFHDAIYNAEYTEMQKVRNGQLTTSENNGNLNRDFFKGVAAQLKINANDFLACYDSGKYKSKIDDEMKEVQEVLSSRGMDQVSTPTILIGDKIIQGAQPYSVFAKAIDSALGSK